MTAPITGLSMGTGAVVRNPLHEERFPLTRLSASCGFTKQTIAGMRRNGRNAPKAVVALALHTCEDSTDRGH